MQALLTFIESYSENNRVHTKSMISRIYGDLVVPTDGYTCEWVNEPITYLKTFTLLLNRFPTKFTKHCSWKTLSFL